MPALGAFLSIVPLILPLIFADFGRRSLRVRVGQAELETGAAGGLIEGGTRRSFGSAE